MEGMLATWCYGLGYSYKWLDADDLEKKGLVVEQKEG